MLLTWLNIKTSAYFDILIVQKRRLRQRMISWLNGFSVLSSNFSTIQNYVYVSVCLPCVLIVDIYDLGWAVGLFSKTPETTRDWEGESLPCTLLNAKNCNFVKIHTVGYSLINRSVSDVSMAWIQIHNEQNIWSVCRSTPFCFVHTFEWCYGYMYTLHVPDDKTSLYLQSLTDEHRGQTCDWYVCNGRPKVFNSTCSVLFPIVLVLSLLFSSSCLVNTT